MTKPLPMTRSAFGGGGGQRCGGRRPGAADPMAAGLGLHVQAVDGKGPEDGALGREVGARRGAGALPALVQRRGIDQHIAQGDIDAGDVERGVGHDRAGSRIHAVGQD